MEGRTTTGAPGLQLIETVRCLECALVYSKPSGGGVVDANPGCPECGYVGWLSAAIPFTEEPWRHRSGADLRLLPNARSG